MKIHYSQFKTNNWYSNNDNEKKIIKIISHENAKRHDQDNNDDKNTANVNCDENNNNRKNTKQY